MSVSTVLFGAIVGLLTYIAYKIHQNFNYWQSRGIACETPSYLLGSLRGLGTKRAFIDIWTDYYKKFKGTGPFAGFYWFQRPAVFALDANLIKLILIKDFNKFTDRGFFSNERDDPLTGSLFQLDGHKWRSMRNKLSPTFTSGKMKNMFPTLMQVGDEFVRVFSEKVKKNNHIDVKDLVERFTMDVIGTCAFGIECNSLRDPDAEFRAMSQKAFSDRRHGTLGQAFLNSFPELARKLRLKQTPDHIEQFFMRIVRETVAMREQQNIRRNDFMDMLIDLKNNKMIKLEIGEDLTNLTIEEIAAQAFVFLIAGFELSSTTMGFALYELAQHEDIQQKVREEINAVLAEHNGDFTYDCMKKMQYLEQVISETLRLYTALPVMNRLALEDYVVPGHPNFVIKKGMPIIIPAGPLHRDADYYPNPEVFNPDHFSPEKVKQRDSIEYLPFGDGPRNCIGMRFGLMQSRMGLALVLKNFKFSVCDQTPIPIVYDMEVFLLSSRTGIYLKVERV